MSENHKELVRRFNNESDEVLEAAAELVVLLKYNGVGNAIRHPQQHQPLNRITQAFIHDYEVVRKQVPAVYTNAFLVSHSCGESD